MLVIELIQCNNQIFVNIKILRCLVGLTQQVITRSNLEMEALALCCDYAQD